MTKPTRLVSVCALALLLVWPGCGASAGPEQPARAGARGTQLAMVAEETPPVAASTFPERGSHEGAFLVASSEALLVAQNWLTLIIEETGGWGDSPRASMICAGVTFESIPGRPGSARRMH